MSAATAGTAAEAATIARRMAFKLGCETIALVGCARPALITALASSRLAGFDAPAHVGYAAALLPGEIWRPLSAAPETIGRLATPFAMVSFAALDALDDELVARILDAVPAALVHDVDDVAGHGAGALREQLGRLRERGLEPVHAELIAPLGSRTHRRTSPAAVVASGGGAHRARALVGTGLHGLHLDPQVDSFSPGERPCRVCIVSYEVVGPTANGGIGTANTSLALALARAGHEVTLLYTGDPKDEGEHEHWRRHFADRDVRYEQLDGARVASIANPNMNVKRAWAAYEFVLARDEERGFDVIHGPECQGHLAYVALARLHGTAFREAQVVSGVHSTTRWCWEANRQAMGTLWSLIDEQLEQVAVAASDVVISPSGYMLAYLRNRGWRLPRRAFVQQYVTSEAIRGQIAEGSVDEAGGPPTEIVFFGRLETRKGIDPFCRAMDRLAGDPEVRDISVTFLGKSVLVRGEPSVDHLARRTRDWPWPVRFETTMSQPEAVAYLRDSSRLAVVPSLVDNSPNTVYEAIALGIPIVVSRSGGTSELIAVEDLERCSFAGWPEDEVLDPVPADAPSRAFEDAGLADVLRGALHARAAPVRAAVDGSANEASHVAWHAALAGHPEGSVAPAARHAPSVSILLCAGEDPRHPAALAAALAACDGEIVLAVADRGRPLPASAEHWNVLEVGAVSPGRAQNLIARAASGDLLLFLPDDVMPAPHLAASVRRAAERSDAELFVFAIRDLADGAGNPGPVVVPIGGPAILGLAYPYFENSGFAIRTETFRALGGFNESGGLSSPGVDLLTRAALGGHQVDVVAEVLGSRTTPHPRRALFGGEVWLDGNPWHSDAEQQLELLAPFRGAGPLDDLPTVYRDSQELLHQARQHNASMRQAYAELAAHAERLQSACDELAAAAQRPPEGIALSERRLRRRVADGERHRIVVEAEMRRLRAALEVVYGSRSWRLTAALRALAARRRIRSDRHG